MKLRIYICSVKKIFTYVWYTYIYTNIIYCTYVYTLYTHLRRIKPLLFFQEYKHLFYCDKY